MDSVKTPTTLDCLVVGVGGQGVVLASRLVAWASMASGAFVRTAETIGMSQRGGSVASHVRVAPTAEALPSSLIGRAGADLLLCFEPGEALRAFSQLKPGGALVCANRPIAAAAAGTTCDVARQAAWLEQHVQDGRFLMVDASVLEREGLSPRCLNVLLLGAAVGLGALPFGAEELGRAMEGLMRPKLVPMNVQALQLGIGLTNNG